MLFCLDKQQGDKKPCVTLERVNRKATYNNPSFPQLVPSDHPPPLAHGTPHKFAPQAHPYFVDTQMTGGPGPSLARSG